ncbi:MAG: RdgB/HAM1 family non-canonical purine NTP pyrophosphatase [Pseudomonadota bacterium]
MKIVLATQNRGKLAEFQTIMPKQVEILPQQAFTIPSIEETGLSFVENAILKARHASYHSHLPAIADDSGLEVDALKGAPGIYSARYAGEQASAEDRVIKLLDELRDVDDNQRQARFCCVLVYLRHANDPTPIIAYGFLSGYIATAAKGTHGFGYDPILYLPAYQCTVAELAPEIKNTISHRANALQSLLKKLKHIIDKNLCTP